MFKFPQNRQWVVLVWFIVAFYLFPLTPPISQHQILTDEEIMLGQYHETSVSMRLEPMPSKVSIVPLKPRLVWHEKFQDFFYLALWVVFFIFLRSKIPKLLKRHLLEPLKFTSLYVGIAHFSVSQK